MTKIATFLPHRLILQCCRRKGRDFSAMEGNSDVKGESNLRSDRTSIIVCNTVHKVDLFDIYFGLFLCDCQICINWMLAGGLAWYYVALM